MHSLKKFKVKLVLLIINAVKFLLHTNDMAEPAQPVAINRLHNVYVVEEPIQLTVGSHAEIIANFY